ncbi:site-specific integrase [Waterburya agarophytonicola K14]|uniref:Site-specific integrase n=1 Tax=Waterburya agarophytonicola KI4 TaxID=2874699 RepID=A0A964FLQ5_9CYAN|nr:tyrosine-type recombinase/integrase [Waterburya agarophytonicola]MCC0179939.1 site-specific integrase [Waterburya agarophytonicola KI4]
MKNNRKGQAALWTPTVIKKMRSRLNSPMQRLIFEISLFTGERMGAIVQLKSKDVYDSSGKVLGYITFAANTRKSSKHGKANTRQVIVHPDLKFHLERYSPPSEGYLFPTNSSDGYIQCRAVDKYWRKILTDLGYSGFSTHSSRRWVINELRKAGVAMVTISEVMGMNIQTVRHYLDHDPIEAAKAIALLNV